MDYKIASEQLLSTRESLLQEWFPSGKLRSNGDFVIGNVQGDEGDSLSVSPNGAWYDFNTRDGGGDLISLYAAKYDLKQSEAKNKLVEQYGLSGHGYKSAKKYKQADYHIGVPPDDAHSDVPCKSGWVGRWPYQNKDGRILFHILRYNNKDGSKRFQQWSWDDKNGRWIPRAYPEPRPLYGLPDITNNPAAKILLVEGEKCADAARSILSGDTLAVTWPGGSSAVQKVDWSPLKGRSVIIWPDADEPGIDCASRIAKWLHELNCKVSIVDLTDVPDKKWDIADAIESGWDNGRIRVWMRDRLKRYEPPRAKDIGNWDVDEPEGGVIHVYDDYAGAWRRYGLQVNKGGAPINNTYNIKKILTKTKSGIPNIWYNEFDGKITITEDGEDRAFQDRDIPNLLVDFNEKIGMATISKDALWTGVSAFAMDNRKNPVQEWVDSCQWDGVERVKKFFHLACGVEQDPYVEAVSKNMLVSMMARIYSPGCKVDTMVILEGPQGSYKSWLLEALVTRKYFTEINQERFNPVEYVQCMRGNLIVEMGELHSFKTADVEAMKSFLSTKEDNLRLPYDRAPSIIPRRCIFVGTTNHSDYLADYTGGRRFWPIRIVRIDLDWVEENRNAIFAEARDMFKAGSEWHKIPADLAYEEQMKRRDLDAWHELVDEGLRTLHGDVTMERIREDILRLPPSQFSNREKHRVKRVMADLGWEQFTTRRNGRGIRVYRKAEVEDAF
jgi:predicted P-loop ATPase/5S rRNA maturation endonuclease (ribonuclease M5)